MAKTGLDIIEYAENARKNFETVPFSEGDGLVLSTLAYISFDGSAFGMTLKDFYEKTEEKKLFRYAKGNGNYLKLLKNCASSPRFGNLVIRYAEEESSWEKRFQFSGTIFQSNLFYFVGFRGTDEQIVGWLEDLDLLGKEILDSQILALSFLKKTLSFSPSLPVYTGGHSKGGNLAVFATSYLQREEQNRIMRIFSYDGPGFSEKVRTHEGFRTVLPKIDKISPTMSLFGMLLEFDNLAKPVRCRHFWAMQHDPFSWLFEISGQAVSAKKFNRIARQSNRSSRKVVQKMTVEQKLRFGNLAQIVCEQANVRSMSELSVSTVLTMLSAILKLKKADRKIVRLFFGTFFWGYFY